VNDKGSPPGEPVPDDLPVSGGVRAALKLLRHALDCAKDAQAPPWDFALEIGHLYAAGLTITDLRWLVARDFVEHADETSVHGSEHRSFTPSRGLTFMPITCVLLTAKGAALAASESAAASEEIAGANGKSPAGMSAKPQWDPSRRQLSFGGQTIKQFHVPARNQELILSAFQQQDWPESIDDPLAGEIDIDPRIRLNDAIYRLNNKQLTCLIRFRVNGQGSSVHWSLHASRATRQRPHAVASAQNIDVRSTCDLRL
jgi:hypothetical protein